MKKLFLFLFLFSGLVGFGQKTVVTKTITTVVDKNGDVLKSDSSYVTSTILPDTIKVGEPVYIHDTVTVQLPPIVIHDTTVINNTVIVHDTVTLTNTVVIRDTVTITNTIIVHDTVYVTAPPANRPPVANAGPDKSLQMPGTVTITGQGSDPDGDQISYSWSEVRGSLVVFVSSQQNFTVTPTAAGTYTYRLRVLDSKGLDATDDMTLTVTEAPPPPTGQPQSFSLSPLQTDFTRQFSGAEIWVGNQWNTNIPNVTKIDEYDRFGGGQLETSQGVYNFKPIGDKIVAAAQRGGKFSFGIMTYFPGAQRGYKEVINFTDGTVACYPQYVHNQMQADALKDWRYENTWVPNWNSEYYLSWWERLNAALYKYLNETKYNGIAYKHFINYIDIRGFGEFGEWHMYYEHGKEPANLRETETALIRIIRAQSNAYPDIQLVALSDGFLPGNNNYVTANVSYLLLTGSNEVGEFGWRHDHVGSDLYPETFKYEGINVTVNGERLGELVANKWKVAPIVGEPHLSSTYRNLPAEVQRYHFNSFGNGNYSPSSTIAPNIISASKLAGARLGITGGSVTPGTGSFSITINWNNTGLCPVYEKFNVIYELRQGSTVVKTFTSTSDLKTFLPGTKTTTETFGGVAPGTYEVRIKIINPSGARTLNLNNTGRQSDGSYTLITNLKL